MSEDSTTLTASATGDPETQTAAVRTYRGRKLEDILPQIREELGPDAVILREREGLVGGFGGFFAQRFIEVQARAGGPLIDVYDDDGDHELSTPEAPIAADPADNFVAALRSAASAWTEDDAPPVEHRATSQAELFEQPQTDTAPRSPGPTAREQLPPPAPEPEPADGAHPLDDALAQLATTPEEAQPTASDVAEPAGEPAVSAASEPAVNAATKPAVSAASEPAVSAATEPAVSAASEPAVNAATEPAPSAASEPATSAAEPSAPKPARAAPRSTKAATHAPRKRSAPSSKPTTPGSTEAIASLLTPLPTPTPTPTLAPMPAALVPAPAPSARVAVRAPTKRSRQPKRLRKAITRRLGPAPGIQVDKEAALAVARDLTARGASDELASVLVSEAAAHGSVFADGHGLRAGARAQLARRITAPAPLPATGAAVAFVGAGGSGKTSCAAALASAYARTSTLAVSALALRCPDGGRMLAELLRGDRAEVQSIAPPQAARALQDRRPGGLVILDTAAVNPSDSGAVGALSADLEPLALDAIYVTLPATLGPQAARSVVASFRQLGPIAITITHADETDQIGVAVELVAINLIPLAYVHAGTDPTTALNALDPRAIAARLLP